MVTMNWVTTARLRLEPLEPGHASLLFDGLCDERLYKWDDGEPPPSVDWLRSRYEMLSSRRSPDGSEIWLNWALWSREGSRYIGFVQATLRRDKTFVAYVLFGDAWGQGLGQEAVRAMVQEITSSYGISEFFATAVRNNLRSIRLLLALGFNQMPPEQVMPAESFGNDVTFYFKT